MASKKRVSRRRVKGPKIAASKLPRGSVRRGKYSKKRFIVKISPTTGRKYWVPCTNKNVNCLTGSTAKGSKKGAKKRGTKRGTKKRGTKKGSKKTRATAKGKRLAGLPAFYFGQEDREWWKGGLTDCTRREKKNTCVKRPGCLWDDQYSFCYDKGRDLTQHKYDFSGITPSGEDVNILGEGTNTYWEKDATGKWQPHEKKAWEVDLFGGGRRRWY